jgi:hypothetical protein
MKINQHNYEQYFLDHAEGKLSPEMEKELVDFLQVNPQLKAELEQFEITPLPHPEIQNNRLKKKVRKSIQPTINIREDNIEEWLIREAEGMLSGSELAELDEFLSLNPAYSYDQKAYHLSKLAPDPDINYPRKEELKRRALIIPARYIYWTVSSVAAMMLLFFGIRFLWQAEEVVPQVERIALSKMEPVLRFDIKVQKAGFIPGMRPKGIAIHGKYTIARLNPIDAGPVQSKDQGYDGGIALAMYPMHPIQVTKAEEKPMISRVFNNMFTSLKEDITSISTIPNIENTDLNLWAIAQVGVEGYNSLTNRELELYVKRNEEGKVTSYSLLEEDYLLLSRDRNRD